MDVVALLEVQAINTKRTLARHVVDYFAGVYRVLEYPLDPNRPAIIVKRFMTRQQAEDFLLTLCPKPTPTKVDC